MLWYCFYLTFHDRLLYDVFFLIIISIWILYIYIYTWFNLICSTITSYDMIFICFLFYKRFIFHMNIISYHLCYIWLSSWIDRRTLKHCDGSMIVLLGCIWRRKQLLEDVFMFWVPHVSTCFKLNGLQAVNLFEISRTHVHYPVLQRYMILLPVCFQDNLKKYIYLCR